MKNFNQSILNINEDDLDFLLEKSENNESEIQSEDKCERIICDIGKNILYFDHYNIFKINDIDYLILKELKSNKMISQNKNFEEKHKLFLNEKEENIIRKNFQLEKFNINNKLSQILNKSFIILG